MKTTRKFLTKDEELELGTLIQAHFKAKERLESGEKLSAKTKARLEAEVAAGIKPIDTLVNANLGLVYDRARIFKTRYSGGPEYEDLVQEGMAGLLTAVKKYDPSRGNKFSTVAYYWIAQAVARGTNKTGRTVRLPENRINDYSRMTAIANSPEAEEWGQTRLDEEIMTRLKLSPTDLRNIRAAAATPASLNKVVSSEGGNTRELMDFVGEKNATRSSEETVIAEQLQKTLLKAIYTLEPVKRDVILATFSLSEFEDVTVEDVKELYDLPHFRLKRIQTDAVKELKIALTSSGLSFADFVGLV
jgi:RNA polymerase sigma factor (sigma-70 family)